MSLCRKKIEHEGHKVHKGNAELINSLLRFLGVLCV